MHRGQCVILHLRAACLEVRMSARDERERKEKRPVIVSTATSNHGNEIEMHSSRSRPLRRPSVPRRSKPGRKETTGREARRKTATTNASCRLPRKYMPHCAFTLFTEDLPGRISRHCFSALISAEELLRTTEHGS